MNKFKIDIFIVTEAKGWQEEWTRILQGDKYKVGTITNYTNERRGGIVTLYRLGQISIKNCYAAQSTFNILSVTFESGKHSQNIDLIPTYINPDPNEKEKDAIKQWITFIEEILENSTNPLMIMGDLNKRGIK